MQANRKKHSLQEIMTIAIRLGKTVFQNSKQFLESESGVARHIPNYQVGIYACYIRDVGGFVRQLSGFVHQTTENIAHRGNVIFLHKMDTIFYVIDLGRRKGTTRRSLAYGVSV